MVIINLPQGKVSYHVTLMAVLKCGVVLSLWSRSQFISFSMELSILFSLCMVYVEEAGIKKKRTLYFSSQNFRTHKLQQMSSLYPHVDPTHAQAECIYLEKYEIND